jgi:hypothetical protein
MYDGEPITRPVAVTWVSSRILATPKSVSLARSPGRTITFAGFTSRWTMPTPWAEVSAPSTSRPRRAARAGASGPSSATSCDRLGASTSSITSQIEFRSSSTS